MRALILRAGQLTLADVPLPNRPGECLVRIVRAGICGTDLQMLEGYADFTGIPGHEFVGVVEQAPEDDGRWIGRRVVGEINIGCGSCEQCAQGVKEHCALRTVVGIRDRDGAFAEYLTLPAANLHHIPDGVSDDEAVFVEPLAAACRVLEQVAIDARTRVAVVGDGRLGNLVARVVRTRTPRAVLFGRHARKLQIARKLGIDTRTAETGHDDLYDVVIDATGRREGLDRALELVRPRGTVVLKSTFHGEAATKLWPVVVHEITVAGSRCGPFARAIELLAAGTVKTAPLVFKTFALDDYAAAFAAARNELKVLISPASPA
jgi:2-desacetyl-2-hydroxyethyl bacteriochlorophyllide A dehydrogenase